MKQSREMNLRMRITAPRANNIQIIDMSRLLSRTRLALPAQVARSQVSCVRYESTRTSKEDQPATGGSNVQGSQAGATGLTEVEPAREVVSADVISGVPGAFSRANDTISLIE